jgi:hypothetical protein
MNYHTTTCECGHVCEFEECHGMFMRIVQTAKVNAQVQRARGVPVTAKLYGKLVYLAYIVAVFGWLGRGNRRPQKSVLLNSSRRSDQNIPPLPMLGIMRQRRPRRPKMPLCMWPIRADGQWRWWRPITITIFEAYYNQPNRQCQ